MCHYNINIRQLNFSKKQPNKANYLGKLTYKISADKMQRFL